MTDSPPAAAESQRLAAPPASTRVIIAATLAWTLGLFSYWAQPQLLGPIMDDYGLGEEAVGWLFSLENLAYGLTILLVAGPLARYSRSGVAIGGAALFCAGNVASTFAGSYESLLLTRWFVGVGGGLIGAAGTAAMASTGNPERAFAVATVGSNLLWSLEPMAIPFAIVPFSSSGGFLLLAGASLVMAPAFVWLLPPRAAAVTAATGEAKPSLWAAPNRILALVALSGTFVFEIGQGGVWTFVAQIAEQIGMNEHATGTAMTVTGLAGLIGGVVAAWLGNRIERKLAIAIGIGLNALAAVGLAFTDDVVAYYALMWLWTVGYTFVVPYLMGALTAMDDLGRWVVANDGIWTLGDAFAPGLAGLVVERTGSYALLGGMAFGTGLACTIAMVLVLVRFDAQRRRESGVNASSATGDPTG
jgi:DHA1 family inner membrane transport protein